jgi:methyl-accepting chemotaxis protein
MDQEERLEQEEAKDLRETVQASLGGLESLVAKIPGYKGYKQKELRREADKLLRMQVAAKLGDQRKRITSLQNKLISQAQIELLDDMERAMLKLQLLIDRISTASYGYAGLFDAVKVKEEQLDALYEYDSELLEFVDEIAAEVDQVASAVSAREGIADAIEDLVDTVDEANTSFDHRHEAILRAENY